MHLTPAAAIWIGPVPASNELILQVPAQFNGTYAWRLHDAGGRIVLRGDGLRAGKQTVSIDHLSNGMYQMSIWDKERILQQQWIIKQ
ncbi:MAG: T9SS type A sorting domain-containing protein [Chitinophagaceae bacterium]